MHSTTSLRRVDILMFAYRLVRANKGSPGIDGVSFEAIESAEGVEALTLELAQALKERTYQTGAVRRVNIPKGDGTTRPLGIPTIRDRVAQMAMKLVIEPIFEADFCPTSYGFRPQKSAHDAVDAIADSLHQGYTEVIDAGGCRNTSTASRIKSSWPSLPSALWMGESCISSNNGSKQRSSKRTKTARGDTSVAARETASARRKAGSSHPCYRTATCTCLTG